MRPLVFFATIALLHACTSGAALDAGRDTPPACPADPPASGAACTSALSCHWLRCGGAGAVTARCAADRWDVSAAPCPIDCNGTACADGQVCSILQGGAQSFVCVDDPCDGAALEACMCGACPSAEPERCSRSGFTVTCNTCFEAICP